MISRRYDSLLLEAGAVCGSSARTDLCGGCQVTGIPTATLDIKIQEVMEIVDDSDSFGTITSIPVIPRFLILSRFIHDILMYLSVFLMCWYYFAIIMLRCNSKGRVGSERCTLGMAL